MTREQLETVLNDTIKMVDTKEEVIRNMVKQIVVMTEKLELLGKIHEQVKITNKEDSTVLGYAVDRLLTLTKNKDGSLSYCGFFEHKNGAQWEAERVLDRAIQEITKQTITGRA